MKKKLSILLFALMAGFLFSACSKDEAPAPKQESAPTTPARAGYSLALRSDRGRCGDQLLGALSLN